MKRCAIVASVILSLSVTLLLAADAPPRVDMSFAELFLAPKGGGPEWSQSDEKIRVFLDCASQPTREHKLLIISDGAVVNDITLELTRGGRVVLPRQKLPGPSTEHAVIVSVTLAELHPDPTDIGKTDRLFPEPVFIAFLSYRAK